jgi:hypothetical protein
MPIVVLSLIEQVLRLINNIIEGKSPEQRRAEGLIGLTLLKTLTWPFLPEDTKAEVDKLMGQ